MIEIGEERGHPGDVGNGGKAMSWISPPSTSAANGLKLPLTRQCSSLHGMSGLRSGRECLLLAP